MTTSWDCFDTLVARRFFSPLSVFDAMGRQYSLPNFTERRKAAESRAPWTLNSIYDELAKDYGWSAKQKEYYKQEEIAAEIDHCCPVNETIRKVKDGDLIVSDMYLPQEAIAAILKKCGLTKDVAIHVSTGGKSSGQIWAMLPPIETHIGDNYHSDVTSPQEHGIQGIHFQQTAFTDLEAQIGGHLALLMRMVRLANPYEPASLLHSMWLEQSQLNIPALILAAMEVPAEGVAFVMRDCVHLQPIHEAIWRTSNTTFHCSRLILKEGGAEWEQYVKNVAYKKTIVDLQGTGTSVINYWEKTFHETPRLIYVTGTLAKGTLLVPCFHDAIERFNSSPLGSLLTLNKRAKCEFSQEVLDCQANARDCAIAHIPYFSFAPNREALTGLVDLMPNSVTFKENTHQSNHESTICTQ